MSHVPEPADDSRCEPFEPRLGQLCKWASSLSLEDIPKPVLLKAALVLGDNIAATVSAADEPQVRAYHDRLVASDPGGPCTLLRRGGPRLSMLHAALGNGMAVTWNELDDGYTQTAVHPGALSQPLILAAGQAHGHRFADVMLATVVAYEVGARFANTWPGTLPRIHPHGAFNAVCAAAGLARLRRFDASTFEAALSGAVTMVSPGPYSHALQGALIRNAWPAAGLWLGHFACEMAQLGVSGTATAAREVYEQILGAPVTRAEQLTEGLGQQWAVAAGYHKLYGSCHHAHAAMEALESILQDRPELRGGRSVRRLSVQVSHTAMKFDHRQPTTALAAKFSIVHAVAATLAHGAQEPSNFFEASLSDPLIAQLRQRVTLAPLPHVKPWPYDRPARVSLELDDGSQVQAFCEAALGSPARPLDHPAVMDKITRLSRRHAPGLPHAVQQLREHLQQDRLDALDLGPWMAGITAAT
jgi:2-methylcitrate dehydratase PrpD